MPIVGKAREKVTGGSGDQKKIETNPTTAILRSARILKRDL